MDRRTVGKNGRMSKMTKDNCRIGYPKSQAWILKVLPFIYKLIADFTTGTLHPKKRKRTSICVAQHPLFLAELTCHSMIIEIKIRFFFQSILWNIVESKKGYVVLQGN